MPLTTLVQTRKERRKLERKKRKRQPGDSNLNDEPKNVEEVNIPSKVKKLKREITKSVKHSKVEGGKLKNDHYGHLDPDLADSMRRDDEEIAALQAKLGLGKSKSNKQKLNKEYAKLEGYGDDFGDFLDDLDDVVTRVSGVGVTMAESDDDEQSENEEDDVDIKTRDKSPYDHADSDMAAALQRDDEEIAELERKLGLGKKKDNAKLYKEYKLEGYGDDFGTFLEDLDDLVSRVKDGSKSRDYERKLSQGSLGSEDDGDSEDSEEEVPMKDPTYDELDEDDSVLDELEREEEENGDDEAEDDNHGNEDDAVDSDEDSAMDSDSEKEEPDHDVSDTYTPSKGEDIYGNKIDTDDKNDVKTSKYVPPHLRNTNSDDSHNDEKLRAIRRGLNNALNRLSEDTLVSVAQQISQLYSLHPTQMVHEILWKNTKDACVHVPVLMKGMIPVYVGCMIGAHIQTGDTVQIGEYMIEAVVSELWNDLEKFRRRNPTDTTDESLPAEIASKHICNRMLILCYLYNFNIVHCSFMYDIVRHLIEKFSEVDIECLLLLLSHCGRSLRSDDPLALKEIVLLVQKKKAESTSKEPTSRVDYMVSAITDLKNNKRRKQDDSYGEKTAKLRKIIGQIKSAAAKTNTAKTTSESSLRISLQDILNADTKGRWWKVGASWVGNQYRYSDEAKDKHDRENSDGDDNDTPVKSSSNQVEQDETLLKLASKFRMNTDRKRAIFCIIMGSEDCEDAFEKLCRSSMLQNKSERDTCRVLFECCLNEKSYNKFYGHLAARMSEFQPQCKFSLQLAFWDIFKQFDTVDVRKAANLAKFLFDLVVTHQLLKLMTVIKAAEISEDDMEESALIFLTILLSSILDHFDDTEPIKAMFAGRHSELEDTSRIEQEEGVRASLLVFFMETLKNSPKNLKGSQFHKNFKAAVKALDTDGFGSML